MFAEVYCIGQPQLQLEIKDMESIRPYQLFWNDEPEITLEKEHLLAESTQSIFQFDFEAAYEHPVYFTIAFRDGVNLLSGIRILPVKGMYNVRDLGGYPTRDGRHVKWGMLYRGDHLYNIKEEGIPYLQQLDFNSIVDFRNEQETEKFPNNTGGKEIPQYHFVPDGHIAAFAGSLQNEEAAWSHERQLEMAKEQVKKDKNLAANSMIQQQIEFVHTPFSRQAYKNTLELMAKADALPLYFHCKGGKDRTGFAAMLIFGILGVEDDWILYDYLLTNRAREKKNQRYLENFRKMAGGDEEVAQYLFSIFDTRKEYLQAAITEIREQYGDILNYVTKELGIAEETIQTLQSLYLEG